MKKTLLLIMTAVFAVVLTLTCFAEGDPYQRDKYVIDGEIDSGDIELIQSLIDAEPEFYAAITNLFPGKPLEELAENGALFPVYTCASFKPVYDAPEEQLAETLISKEYSTVIYLAEKNAMYYFGRRDGKMRFRAVTGNIHFKDREGAAVAADFSKAAASRRLSDERGDSSGIEDFKVVKIRNGFAEYIKTANSEYVIPYLMSEFTEFDSGRIYDRHEAVELLKKEYPPDSFALPTGEPVGGTTGSSEPVSSEPEVYDTTPTETAKPDKTDESVEPQTDNKPVTAS